MLSREYCGPQEVAVIVSAIPGGLQSALVSIIIIIVAGCITGSRLSRYFLKSTCGGATSPYPCRTVLGPSWAKQFLMVLPSGYCFQSALQNSW